MMIVYFCVCLWLLLQSCDSMSHVHITWCQYSAAQHCGCNEIRGTVLIYIFSTFLNATSKYKSGSSERKWSFMRLLAEIWAGFIMICVRDPAGADVAELEILSDSWILTFKPRVLVRAQNPLIALCDVHLSEGKTDINGSLKREHVPSYGAPSRPSAPSIRGKWVWIRRWTWSLSMLSLSYNAT